MKAKIDIAPKRKTRTLQVDSEPLEINLDLAPRVVAEAMRDDLRRAIESQPHGKWDRTGHLLQGLTVSTDGTEVRAPDDRLNREDVRERFREEVMADNSLGTKAVDKAIGDWLIAMMGGK